MPIKVAKVQRKSAEVEAADHLWAAILSGAAPLGARLTELGLAEQLGVSRTTVRTVLHQLVQKGLVVQVPYVGWSVMTLSPRDACELYSLRGALESLAAGLVAEAVAAGEDNRVGNALRDRFDQLATACDKACGGDIAAADMALHRAVIELSHHSRLSQQYEQIQHQVQIYIRSSDALVGQPATVLDRHRPIVEAILSGDPQAAREAVTRHLETEGRTLVQHLETLDASA